MAQFTLPGGMKLTTKRYTMLGSGRTFYSVQTQEGECGVIERLEVPGERGGNQVRYRTCTGNASTEAEYRTLGEAVYRVWWGEFPDVAKRLGAEGPG